MTDCGCSFPPIRRRSVRQGEFLEATGKVVRAGRTLTVCQLEVHGLRGNERTLVAIGQQTLICMHGRPDTDV